MFCLWVVDWFIWLCYVCVFWRFSAGVFGNLVTLTVLIRLLGGCCLLLRCTYGC